MITKIGFTGSREGMTDTQADTLYLLLNIFKVALPSTNSVIEFGHGDCEGADEQAHLLATYLGYRTIAFPPVNPKLRAFCKADEVLPVKGYLDRDRNIVDWSDVLLAAPKFPPRDGSGSWYTYNYAYEQKRRAWLL